ncbi:MAG: hypothetical protein DHS20C11_14450 [Lysobacteraceae bacterium]|nr:MAG: hypothetical protein DHS20C11_14450 [Xanthomonadaceae bacterium]
MDIKRNLLIATLVTSSQIAAAADGDLDTTFNSSGTRLYAVDLDSAGTDQLDHALPMNDGSIVLVGTAQQSGNHKLVVAKLLASGQVDSNYGSSGETVVDINVDRTLLDGIGATLQADGKLVVAATITRGVAPFDQNVAIVRLNTDGTMDTSFSGDGLLPIDIDASRDDRAHAVAIDSQGRIVVAGAHIEPGGTLSMMSLRVTANGTLDAGYAGGVRYTEFVANNASWATSVAIGPDDEVFVGGCTFSSFGDEDFAFWKLTSLGHDDTTFDDDGKQTFWFDVNGTNDDCMQDMALRPEGGLVAVGDANDGTTDGQIAVAVIDNDGEWVTEFGNQTPRNGRYLLEVSTIDTVGDIADAVAIQADGKIVMAITVPTTDGLDIGALRINSDGSTDTSFGFFGLQVFDLDFGGDNEGASSIALDSQQRIVIGASALLSTSNFDFDYLAARLENSNDTILKSTFGGQLQ